MTDCLFCKIAQGKIPSKKVLEDDQVFAFHDINPQAPTHVLIVPKRHIASVQDATDGDGAVLGHLVLAAKKVATQLGLHPDGYRLVINNGAGAGQTVFHVHLHVLGGRVLEWPPG